MNGRIIEINKEKVKDHLGNLVMRNSFQETFKRHAGSRSGSVMSGTEASEKCRTPEISVRTLPKEFPHQGRRRKIEGFKAQEVQL